ncbi:DUF305 domain-containing protein [Emticicia sp. BO119]|nr:DUF305 domain-containing protein [Emticicia sp. BO119]
MKNNNYNQLFFMLTLSFIIMYAVMFLNVSQLNHIYVSTTRFYMALLMTLPMGILMLLFMSKMYGNKKLNSIIILICIIGFGITLTFLRKQTFIEDKQYMKAMISHHSSAILTSEHAQIKDKELRKLADEIIEGQKKEITQMKEILDRMDKEN